MKIIVLLIGLLYTSEFIFGKREGGKVEVLAIVAMQ